MSDDQCVTSADITELINTLVPISDFFSISVFVLGLIAGAVIRHYSYAKPKFD